MRSTLLFLIYLSLIVLSGCTSSGVAGTGTNAGNGKVVALVVYPGGEPATGVELYLRDPAYLRDTATVHIEREADTATNNSGYFEFDSLPDGTYQLEIHNRCRFAKLVSFVVENGLVHEWKDTIVLQEVSALDGAIATDDIPEEVPVYVQIQGMEYVERVSPDGYYFFRGLPAGKHNLTFVSGKKEIGTVVNYAVITEASKSTVVEEVSFPVSLVHDTLYVREILDQNGLMSKPVSEVITIAKGRVFNLRLDTLGLTTIPRGLGRMRARHISMTGNKLQEIPYGISRNKAIITIDISHNNITTVPGFLAGIPHLKVLKLSHNEIDSISEGVTNLMTLRHLDLSSNLLTVLPNSIGNLQELDTLELQNNDLVGLPKDIVNLTILSHLNINGNRLGSVVTPIAQWIDTYSSDSLWRETQKQ